MVVKTLGRKLHTRQLRSSQHPSSASQQAQQRMRGSLQHSFEVVSCRFAAMWRRILSSSRALARVAALPAPAGAASLAAENTAFPAALGGLLVRQVGKGGMPALRSHPRPQNLL